MTSPKTYRADVDGLRAVAVLLVVLYHFGFGPSGGFIGVDVFFVISGFLITQIVRREVSEGTFTLASFYERRLRRIYPALLAVLAFTLVAGFVIQTPADFERTAYQAITAVFGTSNFYFLFQSDYFSPASEFFPLLHTWSLAVEEQFYLFWPLAILATFHFLSRGKETRAQVVILAILIVLSLLVAIVLVQTIPRAAFYLIPARAWELAAGAALTFVRPISNKLISEISSSIGLAAILGWSLLIDVGTPFPGWAAIPAVLGTMLIIVPHAQSTIVSRLLSLRPIVFVGLLSYSIYLWHWPLLTYYRYGISYTVSLPSALALLLITFTLSYLSWRFIERPFRRPSRHWRVPAWSVVVSCAAGITVVGLTIVVGAGLPGRLDASTIRLASGEKHFSPNRSKCHGLEPSKSCVYGAGKPTIAVWGDSHGVEFAHALSNAMNSQRGVLTLTSSACPPAMSYNPAERPNCSAHNEKVLNFLTDRNDIKTVILIAHYPPYYLDDYTVFEEGLRSSVKTLVLSGKRVIISGPIPDTQVPVPTLAAVRSIEGYKGPITLPSGLVEEKHRIINDFLSGLSSDFPQVVFVDSARAFCSGETCHFTENGDVLFFDEHHPSMLGARKMSELFIPYLG